MIGKLRRRLRYWLLVNQLVTAHEEHGHSCGAGTMVQIRAEARMRSRWPL